MVVTPHIGQKELYVTSGHYAKYGEDSFQPIKTPKKDEEFLLKPMNCPHHCEIYNSKPFATKNYQNDLPNLEQYIDMNKVENYMDLQELEVLLKTMRIFFVLLIN